MITHSDLLFMLLKNMRPYVTALFASNFFYATNMTSALKFGI